MLPLHPYNTFSLPPLRTWAETLKYQDTGQPQPVGILHSNCWLAGETGPLAVISRGFQTPQTNRFFFSVALVWLNVGKCEKFQGWVHERHREDNPCMEQNKKDLLFAFEILTDVHVNFQVDLTIVSVFFRS